MGNKNGSRSSSQERNIYIRVLFFLLQEKKILTRKCKVGLGSLQGIIIVCS